MTRDTHLTRVQVASIIAMFDSLQVKAKVAREDVQRFNFKQKVPKLLADRLDKWIVHEFGSSNVNSRVSVVDELPDFVKPQIALRSSMTHLADNELLKMACGVGERQGDDVESHAAAIRAKDLHESLLNRLSLLLKYVQPFRL